jgi:predicted transcriptional regulator
LILLFLCILKSWQSKKGIKRRITNIECYPNMRQKSKTESNDIDNEHKNYKKQIEWRRNKVRQLLLRGNTQSEISRNLHISQPTISRDIDFIRSKYVTDSKNTIKRYTQEYINISLGINEIIGNSWKIVDDNRANIRSRLKAMTVIKECYKYKMEKMFRTEEALRNMKIILTRVISSPWFVLKY